MAARLSVCKGCCCGRVDRGNNPVPYDALKAVWQSEGLDEHVKLSLSGCLGPCSMNNVTLMTHGKERVWLGRLASEDDYFALVNWANKFPPVHRSPTCRKHLLGTGSRLRENRALRRDLKQPVACDQHEVHQSQAKHGC